MKLTGNVIFITGGGSGIGRGLAEALHKLGNTVIISGRRAGLLQEVLAANPGMAALEMDVEDSASIAMAAQRLIQDHPGLNVLINNAGIMKRDTADGVMDDTMMAAIVTTNLMGPIRMTSALIEHLKSRPSAAIVNVTSGLAFVPMAATAVYSATKAALHSYTLSQRYRLKDSTVRVLEIAPPYVQTELMGARQASDPRAMPLADFIAETMTLLGGDTDEILTQQVAAMRANPGPGEGAFVAKFNDMMSGH